MLHHLAHALGGLLARIPGPTVTLAEWSDHGWQHSSPCRDPQTRDATVSGVLAP